MTEQPENKMILPLFLKSVKNTWVSVKIYKAFRLGRRGDKPRLLKVFVASEQEKEVALQNFTKLRNTDV